jgi:hypothetical protein
VLAAVFATRPPRRRHRRRPWLTGPQLVRTLLRLDLTVLCQGTTGMGRVAIHAARRTGGRGVRPPHRRGYATAPAA